MAEQDNGKATQAKAGKATQAKADDQAATKPKRRKVVALALGFYNHMRRRPGSQFYLNDPVKDFSQKWMMDVEEFKQLEEARKEEAEEAEANAGGDGAAGKDLEAL